jgi:hypothetical protein
MDPSRAHKSRIIGKAEKTSLGPFIVDDSKDLGCSAEFITGSWAWLGGNGLVWGWRVRALRVGLARHESQEEYTNPLHKIHLNAKF